MKYNDYPIPTDKLAQVLSKQYEKNSSVSVLLKQRQTILEHKNYLINLACLISDQINYLKKNNAPQEVLIVAEGNLNVLKDMGVLSEGKNQILGFAEHCAKILLELSKILSLKDLSYNQTKLNKILFEQIEILNKFFE